MHITLCLILKKVQFKQSLHFRKKKNFIKISRWIYYYVHHIYCTFFQFLSYGVMVSSQLAIILVMFVESSSSPFPVIRSKRSGVLNTYSGAILTLIFFPPNFEFWTYLTMQMQLQHCMMATRRYYSDNTYSLPKEKTLKIWCCTIT